MNLKEMKRDTEVGVGRREGSNDVNTVFTYKILKVKNLNSIKTMKLG